MSRTLSLSLLVLVAGSSSLRAQPAEICGNGVDDNGNNLTDEGCWNLTSGQCESPLSCEETGSVSPKKGTLRYSLPPDVAPKVAYGPGIGFRRSYLSHYDPGAGAPVWKKPLGDRWHHTYMTWLAKTGTGTAGVVVYHTSQGQDVRAPWTSTDGTWDYFKPQAGVNVDYVRQQIAAPNNFQIRTLSGTTLVYNSSGRLTEIWDLASGINKVLVAYDGNGQVSTVTDASDKRRLRFLYSNNRLSTLEYQVRVGSDFVTQHSTGFEYDGGASRDSTSNKFVPANATEWTALLNGTGLANPSSMWLSQEVSGSLADSLGGGLTATLWNTAAYQQTATGWTRKGVRLADVGSRFSITSSTINPASNSVMLVQYIATSVATTGSINRISAANPVEQASFVTSGFPVQLRTRAQSGASTVVGTANAAGNILVVTKLDRSRNELVVYTDRGEILKPTYTAPTSQNQSHLFGDGLNSSTSAIMMYAALYRGSGAEISDTQAQALIRRLTGGSGLTKVTIGGQEAQRYVYNGAGDLTNINDSLGNSLMAFNYSSATPGQVNLIDTPRGVVGFEFNSARAACSGQTVLYFNKGNNLSCNVDADCGTGFLCGGKTGAGATGSCFRGARCLTVSSPNEDVVTAVAPLGPPSETCEGACTEISSYVWNTTSGGTPILDLKATQDPAGYYVTRELNAKGLVTKMHFGDQDSDPTNSNSSREVYYFYDTLFPGKLKEVRRKSDLSISAGSCSAANSTGCARTEYTYYPDTGLLKEIKRSGTTMDQSGLLNFGPLVTLFTYDPQGRLYQIDGPLPGSNDLTEFQYFAGSGSNFKDGFLEVVKRKKDASAFLYTQVLDYSIWGTPTAILSPDNTVTCFTYSAARGHVTQRREAMAGQTNCSTTNSADITTTWTRDNALRLTQLTRADNSCYFYEYDTKSRLQRIKRRDDCNAGSAGDRQELIYDAEGLVTNIETYDSSGVLTAQQPYKYFDSRKLQQIVNPVDVTKYTGLVYDSRGLLSQVNGAGSIGSTTFIRDTATPAGREGRVTTEDRKTNASSSDRWDLTYSWLGAQTQVADEDAKSIQTIIDDFGDTVKIVSADMTYPTLFVYDEARRLKTKIEAFGGGAAQLTHAYSYDNADRRLNTDYHGTCPTGTAQAEIQRVYDAPPSSCPVVGGCQRTNGRLAWVKSKLLCSSAYSATDGSWDQQTFYSYDDAGRMIREDIVYDGTVGTPGSVQALQQSEWTKLSQFSKYTSPAGVALGATYNSGTSNSDSDRVDSIWRVTSSSPVAQNVKWFPFGPLKQYDQMNQIGGLTQRTRIARNLAYRITNLYLEPTSGGASNFQTAITEDAKGRVTSRVYTGGAAGMQNSYFLYDEQDRLLCETTNSVASCPTSGSNIKNSREAISGAYFTPAGDWLKLLRPVPGSTGLMNQFNPSGYGTSHQVTAVAQSDGSPALGTTVFAYDGRGNRTSDDNTSTLTNDRRDYTYDAQGNVINVRGKYRPSGPWRDYDVGSAFDHKNRRVYKFYLDNNTNVRSEWWFYHDSFDRLSEVWYYPNAASPTTYSLFQLSWLDNRIVSFAQTDYPSTTLSKRYVNTDETGRPIDMWSWPASGNAGRVWAINPSAWAFDASLVGAATFQPIRFAGQFADVESGALSNDGTTVHRPGLVLNGYRTYDPFTSSYAQYDPLADVSWSGYLYSSSDPVGKSDPLGLWDGGSTDYQSDAIEIYEDCSTVDSPCWNNEVWGDAGDGFIGNGVPKPPDGGGGGGTNSCTIWQQIAGSCRNQEPPDCSIWGRMLGLCPSGCGRSSPSYDEELCNRCQQSCIPIRGDERCSKDPTCIDKALSCFSARCYGTDGSTAHPPCGWKCVQARVDSEDPTTKLGVAL